jgi:hypothetical protein
VLILGSVRILWKLPRIICKVKLQFVRKRPCQPIEVKKKRRILFSATTIWLPSTQGSWRMGELTYPS